ncbi:glutaredoxin electron transport component of NRDEF (glutaredoxin-like protein) NrdH [Mycobacteroides abscessus subsp. abscessus]|uniref:glutaredoxin domain-containing protein n=1 Tax=Mycobacteroides abscessus TaxID=36809 RepID=UPI000925EF33|nr:glutaredoxin domain-containing protein [Mycobacteroides abscessus]SIJ20785.1 glutaredoxin electron transport component of NRDEF (glutaredoxin-like protein) NrdH [Mycobacteroides abscessus subsp. abscessus]SLH39527.1 glutaredoxin electron transport component of NRDEF (glutaredoxin-like protein) NrdH [Mycobacteroides abscessus subsp. abscessus]
MRNLFHHKHHSSELSTAEPDEVVVFSDGQADSQATIGALRSAGADFELVDVTLDRDALQALKTCGYQEFPVVVHGTTRWCGHQQPRIRDLAEERWELGA